jgi:hypothetical protein
VVTSGNNRWSRAYFCLWRHAWSHPCTNLGLGAANNVTFSNITASGTLGVTGNATFSGTANLAPSQTARQWVELDDAGFVG